MKWGLCDIIILAAVTLGFFITVEEFDTNKDMFVKSESEKKMKRNNCDGSYHFR